MVRQGILASSRPPGEGSPKRLVSSRSTQLGKEDFYVVVIVPNLCEGMKSSKKVSTYRLGTVKDLPVNIVSRKQVTVESVLDHVVV